VPNEIKIEFPQDGLKEMIGGWVIQQMTGDQKEKVLAAAIDYLLTPKKESYQTVASSPLQDAYVLACRQVMTEVAKEMIQDDPVIRAQIKTKLGEGLFAWLESDVYDDKTRVFSEEIGLAIGRAIGKRDY